MLDLEHLLVSLHPLSLLEVLQELLMSVQGVRENIPPLGALGEYFLTRVPAHWVHGLGIHPALKRLWTRWLRSPLKAKLIRPVAKHDSLVVTYGGLGECIEGWRSNLVVVCHLFKI